MNWTMSKVREVTRDWLETWLKGKTPQQQEKAIQEYLQALAQEKEYFPSHSRYIKGNTRQVSPVAIDFLVKSNWPQEGVSPATYKAEHLPPPDLRQFDTEKDAKAAVARFMAGKNGPYAEFSVQFFAVYDNLGKAKIWVQIAPAEVHQVSEAISIGSQQNTEKWARSQGYQDFKVISDDHVHPRNNIPYTHLPSGLHGEGLGAGDIRSNIHRVNTYQGKAFSVWLIQGRAQISRVNLTVQETNINWNQPRPEEFQDRIRSMFKATIETFDPQGRSLGIKPIDLFDQLDPLNKKSFLDELKKRADAHGPAAGVLLSGAAIGGLLLDFYARSKQAAKPKSDTANPGSNPPP
jgi:hypothetical protein